MKSKLIWDYEIEDRDKSEICIWDLCFSPNGNHLIVAAGSKVLVYEANDGKLLHQLKGHKESVFCVTYAKDGKRFASGSQDKLVIIWSTDEMKGILKYNHNESIQCLAFNPVTNHLASCACTDYGLWSSEQKNVNKRKLSARITCCCWTNDGQYLALGLYNGTISLVNKNGEEKVKIERPGGALAPVWSLEWCPSKEEHNDILAVVDWSQKLAFYQLNGKQVQKDRSLGFDPCRLSWFPSGDFILVSGSDRQCSAFTTEGINLGAVCKSDSWIWSCRAKPHPYPDMITANSVEKVSQAHYIAIGSQSGAIEVHELIFTNVNSIYRDRYAYCDGMTDVIVQNLSSSDKVRIKCREVIKKVALYKNKFAVLLSERLLIYEVGLEDENDMRYRMKEKVNLKVDCDHMVITSHHVIFSMEKKMQCYNFQGLREREWIMDSQVRSVKVIGGPPNQEGILVGMKSGQVLQIFITNAFPVTLIEQSLALKSLDISCDRRQLAVIDESNTLHVYDINSKQRIYQEPDATSVVWNATIPELLCYSGKEMLSIKAGNFPPRTQHMKGEVIGYVSSRVHCLVGYRASTIEVPQSTAMYQYMEQRRYQEAYNIACEGVSWSDWSALASAALNDLQLDVARKAFERLRDYHHLRLLVTLEERQKRLGGNLKQNANEREVCMGDILAHEGEFTEAAKSYRRGNAEEKAMHMYSALRLFDQAKEFANKSAPEEKKKLITQQAEWASNTNDKRAAAQMYLEAGEVGKAVEIMGLCGWTDMLIEVARTQDAADRKILERCAFYLNRLGQYPYAAECYSKMGDITSLVNLHVTARHWEEAFAIVKKHSQFKAQVYKPYAQYLAENDKFEEAQAAFHEAGLEAEAVHVLQQLTENAVTESRFNDAAYYYWKLSMQCLSIAREDKSKQVDMINKFHQFQRKASMYYVYFSIQRYTDEPFSSHMPEALFNMSRWLLLTLGNNVPPPGISKVNILYTLAKQSRNVGAYKLARHAYDKLQTLRIPARFRDAVDVGAIALRGKPYNDSEDVLPMCYRCSNTNPLINKEGCVCVNCKEPFVYSFVSFDILPLVEFTLEAGITDEEAVELIAFDQAPKSNKLANRTDNWREDNSATAQSLRLDQLNPSGDNATEDPFSLKLLASETENGIFQPVVLDRDTLKAIPSNEIQILKWPKPLRFQYFKSIMPDISITKCYSCFQLFHTDDFELQALQKGHCPYCRNSTD